MGSFLVSLRALPQAWLASGMELTANLVVGWNPGGTHEKTRSQAEHLGRVIQQHRLTEVTEQELTKPSASTSMQTERLLGNSYLHVRNAHEVMEAPEQRRSVLCRFQTLRSPARVHTDTHTHTDNKALVRPSAM